ncbi:MAG: NapC/NirT family cytochrome c [Rhodospirillaceae bacterium]|nr:NapC/NirT family cytochrome c [Rhodospirillaceae bacterium]
MIRRLWKRFWRPATKFSFGSILIAGGVAGLIFWSGFSVFLEYSNTLEFCTSCHEMDQLVYQEYKKTIHYTNRTGVRVICSDCHVPKALGPKLLRKIKASNELYHKMLGSVNTLAKFESKRMELAQNVWRTMEANDSLECRNCHTYEAMDFHKQTEFARETMQLAMEENMTCIDCHKGIAHKLPDEFEE